MSSRLRGFLLATLSLGATTSFAEPLLFEEDAESGTLAKSDVKPGKWDSLVLADNANSIGISLESAHRGNLGIREVDGRAGVGTGSEGHLGVFLPRLLGDVRLRFWMRYHPTSTTGHAFQAQLGLTPAGAGPGSTQAITLAFLPAPSRIPQLGGFDAAGAYQYDTGDAGSLPEADAWGLYEATIRGIGTPSGERTFHINGKLVAHHSNVNFTGVAIDRLVLGEYYSNDLSFTGTLDFDDVRLSSGPQASTLVILLPPAQDAPCLPLTVVLRSSEGTQVEAPYPFEAELASQQGHAFHADAGCTTPVTTVHFSAGASSATVFHSPASGTGDVLTASYVDFITEAASLVPPPGGSEAPEPAPLPGSVPGASQLRVSCGAGGSGLSLGGVLVVLARLAARGRRRCCMSRGAGAVWVNAGRCRHGRREESPGSTGQGAG